MRKLTLAFFAVAISTMPLCAQNQTQPSKPLATKPSTKSKSTPPAKSTPLTPRERAIQLLNRFTFGPRPGDVEHLLSIGPDQWFEQQLNPSTIPDDAVNRRLNEFTTLNLTPEQALTLFPDGGTLQQVDDGKRPYPADPALAAMYQVQISRLNHERVLRKVNPDGTRVIPQPTEDELAAQKKSDQATAARIAGDLLALPKNQRMAALSALPIPDRIALTTYVGGDQRNLLLADFNPREREIFRAMASGIGASYQIGSELAQAKLLRVILSERQLQEVMTDFWFNHFNVYIAKDSDQWYTTSYERDAIRKNALGKFKDLLFATALSPAMMVYLDNWQSIGPNSLANGVNPANPNSKKGNRGLNENYGRELMELHTLGVDGGYTQADVTALSAILTGWTVNSPNLAGPFQFDPKKHEPGPKQWLGQTINGVAPSSNPTDAGKNEGFAALTILAASPKTAHFISYKLAQRFVADEPPAALVDRMAATYLATDGDIKAILRTLIQSPEFNSRRYFRNKIKTPLEFIASAFRTTATEPANPAALVTTLRDMGMPPYYALPPTGYYITADHWMNTTALIDRLNFSSQLTANKYLNQKFDSAQILALGLLAQPAAARVPGVKNVALSTDPNLVLTGSSLARHILEDTLIDGQISPKTNQLIQQQITETPPTQNPTDTLNTITALILGSPEFQLR